MGNSAPNSSTRPTTPSNTTVAALRKRLESLENQVKRINANRTPASLLVHQLGNTEPMSQVKDGQTLVYNKATGQYEPGTSTYASLQGAGETDSPGLLTQTGGFVVTMLDLGRDPDAFQEVSGFDLDGNGVFQDAFVNNEGVSQWSAEVIGVGYPSGGGVKGQSYIYLGSNPFGDGTPVAFLQAENTILGGVPFGPAGSGNIGFFQSTGGPQVTVTGSTGGNAALASLLSALASYNLIIDSST